MKTSGEEVNEVEKSDSSDNNNIEVIPANPLLPKIICYDVKRPPGCPLKDI